MDDQAAGLANRSMVGLSRNQVRGARGLLDWSMHHLARAAQVSVSSVKRMETVGAQPVSDAIWTAVQDAFEAAGVRFLSDSNGGQGVWLKPSNPASADRA